VPEHVLAERASLKGVIVSPVSFLWNVEKM